MATKKAAKTATTRTRRSKPAQPAPEPEVMLGDGTMSQAEDEENGRMVEATKAANGTETAGKPAGKRGRKAKSLEDLAPVTTCTGCGAILPDGAVTCRDCGAAARTIGEPARREDAQDAPGSTSVAEAEATPATATEPPVKLTKMTIEELRARHLEVIGRETNSVDSAYLQWRLRQAAKGRIPIGPRQPRGSRQPGAFKVVPVRIPVELLARIDEVREQRGIRSRNEFLVQVVTAAVEG